MRVVSLLALLVGCDPATAVLVDPSLLDPGDTDTALTDTDLDTDTDTTPAIPTSWTGVRTYTFPEVWGTQCIDSVNESGVDVTADGNYAGAVAACPQCDQVWLVTSDPDHVCDDITPQWPGIPVATPVLRGVTYDDTGVTLWRFDPGPNGQLAVSQLAFAPGSSDYAYGYTGYYANAQYQVDCTLTLE